MPYVLCFFLALLLQGCLPSQNVTDVASRYAHDKPSCFCEFPAGIVTRIDTDEKVVVLTLDACHTDYDRDMIALLRRERVPAVMFVSGLWIDSFETEFKALAGDPLFSIQNHGHRHKPASVEGRSIYHREGTRNSTEVVEEIAANADRIEALTGKRPTMYRSGTAYYDDVAVRISHDLGHEVVNFDVLSSDVMYKEDGGKIAAKILADVRPGSIIIMHMNHPEWGGREALETVIPELRRRGYRFVLPNL